METTLESLSNDLIVQIADFLPMAEDLALWAATSTRFRSILNSNIDRMSMIRGYDLDIIDHIESFEALGFVEAVMMTDLTKDAQCRRGLNYSLASMDVKKSSLPLIDSARNILRRFSNATIRFDGHCGLGAPNEIAPRFSAARSLSAIDELCHPGASEADNEDLTSRILACHGWGKRIVGIVADMDDNPFQYLARRGRGWTEMYLQLGNLCLPPLPPYYYSTPVSVAIRDFSRRERRRYMQQVMRDAFGEPFESDEESENGDENNAEIAMHLSDSDSEEHYIIVIGEDDSSMSSGSQG